MTLFTLEACLDAEAMAGSDANAFVARVHRAYLDWLDTQRAVITGWRPAGSLVQLAVLRARRAPGNTCLSALQSGTCGTMDKPINDSKGCGRVMRVAPIGLFPAERAFDRASRAAAVRLCLDAPTSRRLPIASRHARRDDRRGRDCRNGTACRRQVCAG